LLRGRTLQSSPAAQHGLLQFYELPPPALANAVLAYAVLAFLRQQEDRNANHGDIEDPHLHSVLAIPAVVARLFVRE
jgi:hypothetical protein